MASIATEVSLCASRREDESVPRLDDGVQNVEQR